MNAPEHLNQRVERERNYHERVWEESHRLQTRFQHVFLCRHVLAEEARHSALIRATVEGKEVLDYGCADGSYSVELIKAGARFVHGLDLDEVTIQRARDRNLPNANFQVGDAHHLPWPDASFDVVVGRSILHHLDLEVAVAELSRVLRPGGSVFFVEPLRHNPLGAVFRSLTPQARTADELPLSRKQVLWMDSVFGRANHGWAICLTMPVGGFTSLLPGVGPDNLVLNAASALDAALCHTPLRWWMGMAYLRWGAADHPTLTPS